MVNYKLIASTSYVTYYAFIIYYIRPDKRVIADVAYAKITKNPRTHKTKRIKYNVGVNLSSLTKRYVIYP